MKKYGSFSTDDENVLELESDDDCITLWSILNNTELYTSKIMNYEVSITSQ